MFVTHGHGGAAVGCTRALRGGLSGCAAGVTCSALLFITFFVDNFGNTASIPAGATFQELTFAGNGAGECLGECQINLDVIEVFSYDQRIVRFCWVEWLKSTKERVFIGKQQRKDEFVMHVYGIHLPDAVFQAANDDLSVTQVGEGVTCFI